MTTCQNFGILNGTTCACPEGFGSADCSNRACASSLKNNTERVPIVQGNRTCTCDEGFLGVNCNLCTTAESCGSGGDAISFGALAPDQTNSNKICNLKPAAYGHGFMSCSTDLIPSIPVAFPGPSHIDFIRNVEEGTFNENTVQQTYYWYDNIQLSCLSSNCTQESDSLEESKFTCPTSQCTIRSSSAWVRQIGILQERINAVEGNMTLDCNLKRCIMTFPSLQQSFNDVSPSWNLGNCTFGECVEEGTLGTDATGSLPTGVAVVIGFIGLIIILLIAVCIRGKRYQKRMRKAPVAPASEGAHVEWRDICYYVKLSRSAKPKRILDNACGEAKQGQVMGVLGPSGAGKSTLVDIIAGRTKRGRKTGFVYFNGKSMDSYDLRKVTGFVAQEDTLPPFETVFECCEFSMNLKLSEGLSKAQKKHRVNETLRILGLHHVANTRVGDIHHRGLSGGEKRRLTIALQLLTSPELLVLDEPLTGLDSKSAKDVVDALHSLASSNLKTTVIMTVHQPRSDIYLSFDHVMLVAHGDIIYSGAPDYAQPYFEQFGHKMPQRYNPADFLLDLAHLPAHQLNLPPKEKLQTTYTDASSSGRYRGDGELGEKDYALSHVSTVDTTKTSRTNKSFLTKVGTLGESTKKRRESPYMTSLVTQFECLCGREIRTLKRDNFLFIFHLGLSIGGGLSQGILSFNSGQSIGGVQNRLGAIFFFMSISAFASLSTIAPFYLRKGIFLRERADNYYHPFAWVLCRVLFDLIPLRIVPVTLGIIVVYWMVGLTPEFDRFIKFWFCITFYYCSTTLFYMINASWFDDQGVATLLSSLEALGQMLFSGFFLNLTKIPPVFRWIQWIVQAKYALEAVAITEIVGKYINDTIQGTRVILKESYIINSLFGFDLSAFWRDAVMVVIFNGIFFIALTLIVWGFLKEKR